MNSQLKEMRDKQKMSQKEFAKLCGISFRAYQNYETGKQSPSVWIALALAKALKSTVEELFVQE